MDKLPILSDREVVRVLRRAGFEYAPKRGKGSHIAMFNPQTRISYNTQNRSNS